MKTMQKFHPLEKGQVIPILVVGLIVMIIMAALILDGGALLLNRRTAQNAADAAVLAGASEFCKNEYDIKKADDNNLNNIPTNIGNIIDSFVMKNDPNEQERYASVIWGYPNTYIDISNPNSIENLRKGEVVVTVQVEHGSFFARLLGHDTLTARATAAAGCFPFGPDVVLPVAYECKPPEEGSITESEDCDYWPLDWDEQFKPSLPSDFDPYGGNDDPDVAKTISENLFKMNEDYIYIVVDSDLICGKDLICDFSEDIVRYQLASSQRGWLNLEGISPSTTSIRNWVYDGNEDIPDHIWLSFIQGNKVPGYQAIDSRIDQIVWIPVFNYMCDYLPTPGTDCWNEAHADFPSNTCYTGSVWLPHNPYAHIITFAPFFPTCIQMRDENNDDVYGALYAGTFYPGENCPGFDLAQENNPDPDKPGESLIKDNTISLEGYFIRFDTLPAGEEISSADLGYYTVSLTR